MRWIENLPNGWAQGVVINGMKSSWSPVSSCVPHLSLLSPILFNIFINDLKDGAEFTLSRFADGTKLGEVADKPEDDAAIHRDLDRLKKWADMNLTQFNRLLRWKVSW